MGRSSKDIAVRYPFLFVNVADESFELLTQFGSRIYIAGVGILLNSRFSDADGIG